MGSVLGAVAENGSSEGIQAAILAMSDATSVVRQEATRVLSVLAEKGDARAIDAVIALLPHHDADFMITAMRVLRAVETGDASCVAQSSAHLEEGEKERCVAVQALRALLGKRSAAVVTLLTRSMDFPVRDGTEHLAVAIANRMETADVDVWPVLVEAYCVVTEVGDERPMAA